MRRLLRGLRRAGERAVQLAARRVLRAVLARRLREWRADGLGRRAVVFAPHQDDEALGCGGTIIRKRAAGAEVTVVFMTDGSASHPDLIPGAELARIRAAEALASCRILGVPDERVLFLELKDGEMMRQLGEAERRVREVLRRYRPEEVFIPHYHDGSPDHLATTSAVLAALRAEGSSATVYQFPVWLWCHWPWIGLPGKLSEIPETLRRAAEANGRLVRDCRCFVRVGDVLDRKRAALEQHRSQLERLVPDPRWFTLPAVANGAFLACFFQDREIFYRHAAADAPAQATAHATKGS
jgi:LmbE family N-acetylglucosaminyl deacetylase